MLVSNFVCCLYCVKKATALRQVQEAHFHDPTRDKSTLDAKLWPLLCISCAAIRAYTDSDKLMFFFPSSGAQSQPYAN